MAAIQNGNGQLQGPESSKGLSERAGATGEVSMNVTSETIQVGNGRTVEQLDELNQHASTVQQVPSVSPKHVESDDVESPRHNEPSESAEEGSMDIEEQNSQVSNGTTSVEEEENEPRASTSRQDPPASSREEPYTVVRESLIRSKMLKITNFKFRNYKRFSAYGLETRMEFPAQPENENILMWLESIVREIHRIFVLGR